MWIIFYVYELAMRDYVSFLLDNEQKHNAKKNSNSCLDNCFPITNILLIPVEGQVNLRKKKTS